VRYNTALGWPETAGRSIALDPETTDATLNDYGTNWCQGTQRYGYAQNYGSAGATNATCNLAAVCGNGDLEAGEQCDEGLANSDDEPDACRWTCEWAYCGDDVTDSDETCDDGGTVGGDGCSATCQIEYECGDGVEDPGEECDEGDLNDDYAPNACRENCLLPHCGDDVIDTGEECDDGNTSGGDGCSATCTNESAVSTPNAHGQLVITEIFPVAMGVNDSVAEWFEITNPGGQTFDLEGCVLDSRGINEFTIVGSLPIGPGEILVFSVSGNPAINGDISVDYIYPYGVQSGQMSMESGFDHLSITCGGVLIDIVEYDTGADWPVTAGYSLSLHPDCTDADANDAVGAWCQGTEGYGYPVSDPNNHGSAGDPNPACDPAPSCP